MDILKSVISVIVLSNLLIHVFYRAFKTKWPGSYFAISEVVDMQVSASPIRFFAFRLLPPMTIITLLIGVFGKSDGFQFAMVSGLLSGLTHSLLTNGRALWGLFRGRASFLDSFKPAASIGLHLIAIIALSLTGLFAGVISSSPIILALTPSTQGLVDNTWSALLAVILVVYLEKLYPNEYPDMNKIFQRSIDSIDSHIFATIEKVAQANNAKASLVKAICIVENLQRPKWFRQIENVRARLHILGTYGIMQVQTNKPTTDTESVQIAVQKYFKDSRNTTDSVNILKCILRYNNSKRYADLVVQAMDFIDFQVNYTPNI